MEKFKFLSNHNIIISESDSSDTVDAKFIICDFDPNKNNVTLNKDTIDTWLSTIELKPLVGKVVTTYNGEKDFSSHNAKIVEKVNEDGQKYKDVEFDTSAFGSFYSAQIEEIDGKEYITANAKIWKRFSQAYEVIQSRANSDNGIKTSWEIQVHESHQATIDGKKVKVIDKGTFIGHALLGGSIEPAYDSSGLLSVASHEDETYTELSEALTNDFQLLSTENNVIKEEDILPDTNISALTTRDLHQKIHETLNPKGWNSNPYYSIWEVYPEDHKILAYNIDRNSEDDYLVFSYTVNEEVVTVGDAVDTKLSKIIAEKTNVNITLDLNETAKLLSEKEIEITRITKEKNQISTDLSEKVDALLSASEKIEQLELSVKELTPFKEQVEAAQLVEQAREVADNKEKLKVIATKGGYISTEEIETSEEIKELIEALDEKGIKALIAERFIKKLEETPPVIETSSKNETEISDAKQNIDNDEPTFNHKVTMSNFLKN